MLAAPTTAELAEFMGVDKVDFSVFVNTALAQATLLFELATGLEVYPTQQAEVALAKNGILEMAEKIYSAQPYSQSLASPFQSESIGSYSYSKAQKALSKGDLTGVTWFDLAVQKLSVRPFVEGSSSPLFEKMPKWPDAVDGDEFPRPFG